jgi:hypothetical protein
MAGRKHAHLKAAGGRPFGRQAVWEAIRRLPSWTITSLADELRHNRGTVDTYVRSLLAGGFIEVCGTEPADSGKFGVHPNLVKPSKVYRLIRDVGVEAPTLNRDGTPCQTGLGRAQMWRTMKLLDNFTPLDLSIAASTEDHIVSERHANCYVTHLHRAGYLALVAKAGPHSQARYRFVKSRNTGPRSPIVQRVKSVFDPNLAQIVWQEDPAE